MKKCLIICALFASALFSHAQTLDFRIGDLTVSASQFASGNNCIQVPLIITDTRAPGSNTDILGGAFTVTVSGDTSIIDGGVTADVVVANSYLGSAGAPFQAGITSPATDLTNANSSGTPTCDAAFNQATQGQGGAMDFPEGTGFIAGSWSINNQFDVFTYRGSFNNAGNAVVGTTTGSDELIAILEIPIVAGMGGLTTAQLTVSAASGTNFNIFNFATAGFTPGEPLSLGAFETVGFNLAAGYEGVIDFVENQAPVTTITSGDPGSIPFSGSVTYTGSATDAEDGDVSNLAWTFDNGTPASATGAGPHVVVYNVSGTHTTTLTGTDSDGAASADSVTVTVGANGDPVPTIDPAAPGDISEGQSITWSGSATDPEGHAVTYAWTFEGGTPASSTDQNPGAVTYAAFGNFTTTLVVTDAFGHTGTDTAAVTVLENAPPVATITSTLPAEVFEGDTVTFEGTVTDSDGTVADNAIVWTFENGTPSSATGVGPHNVVFAPFGNYTVTLTATDDDGAVDTDTQAVTVLEVVCEDASNVVVSGDIITFQGTEGCVYELIENGVGTGIFATVGSNGLGAFEVDVQPDTSYSVGNSAGGGAPSPTVTSVPTLGEWGMIAFVLMLMMAGAVMMRRNREQLS